MMRFLVVLCTLSSSASFIISPSSRPCIANRIVVSKLLSSADDNDNDKSSTYNNNGGLKSYLPTPKRTQMELDKFGRRVHDLKSDGVAKYSKGGVSEAAPRGVMEDKAAPMTSDADITLQQQQEEQVDQGQSTSPSLGQLVGKDEERATSKANKDAKLGDGNVSVDLKTLLPTQKMKFMKLDSFGRRLQRMEDDGTVNYSKEPRSSPPLQSPPSSSYRGTKDGCDDDGEKTIESSNDIVEPTIKYGNLKELTKSVKRPTWTKLDFHGASVPDERRMKAAKKVDTGGGGDATPSGGGVGGSNLKELLPKRATWTKLDFHGASVEDERRTKRSKNSDSSTFNTGQYSELKALLPKRTINWKKGQLLSSGSSPTVTENFRGLREERSFGVKEERQLVMKNDVIASAALSSSDGEDVGVIDDNIDDEEEEEVVKPYQNLRDLLPQRRVTWKGK